MELYALGIRLTIVNLDKQIVFLSSHAINQQNLIWLSPYIIYTCDKTILSKDFGFDG